MTTRTMRVAKWHCPWCREKFLWNEDHPVDDRKWVRTIRIIQYNHFEKCDKAKIALSGEPR